MILFLSLIILLISYFLFRKASGSLDPRLLNMNSYVFYILVIYTFIGSIQIMYGTEVYAYLIPKSKELRLKGWLLVMYTMVGVPIGMLLAASFLKVKSVKRLLFTYRAKKLVADFIHARSGFKYTLFIFSCLSIVSIITIIIWIGLENIPLFNLFRKEGNYKLLQEQRNLIRFHFAGNELLGSVLYYQSNFTIILSYIIYLYWRIEKKTKYLLWITILFLFSILFLTYNLKKGPILYYLIGFLLVNTISGFKIKIKTFFLFVVALIFLIGLLYIFFMGSRTGDSESIMSLSVFKIGLNALMGRVLIGQLVSLYQCLKIFPDLFPFLGFASTGRLIHLALGLPYLPDYGIIVRAFTNPMATLAGKSGHATTFFMGEAWSNFGIVGVIIAPLWVGFVIQIFNILFLKVKKTPLNISLYVFLTLSFPILSNLKGFYYPVWLIQYALILFVLLAITGIFNYALKSRHRIWNEI